MEFSMPPSRSDPNKVSIITEGQIVIIGANGSGKTRLGCWIEERDPERVHRVSAQKSLNMPSEVHSWSLNKAQQQFFYGGNEQNLEWLRKQGKTHLRWGNHPPTHLLNDFEQLMVLLYTEEFEESLKFKDSAGEVILPITKLDRIKKIWEEVLPHRRLIKKAGCIETAPHDAPEKVYNASEMSDGERVIFYLVGECLCAPKNAIIVIDEPEMHLHKSLVDKLWDLIEAKRQDCLFVYLTQDIDFAVSRKNAAKICLKDYDGESWDWYEVPEDKGVPEDIYLKILGSRRPVLFIEGEQESLDVEVYKLAYPDFLVVPLGSSEKVIEAVKSFKSLSLLHYVQAVGIIDRDYRTEPEIESLRQSGVQVLDVAEVENLFLLESVLQEVSGRLCTPDARTLINKIKEFVLQVFENQKDRHALQVTAHAVSRHLGKFNGRAASFEELEERYRTHTNFLDLRKLYEKAKTQADRLIEAQDYEGVLLHFNHKGLVKEVGKFFNMRASGYVKLVINMACEGSSSMIEVMKARLPKLSVE